GNQPGRTVMSWARSSRNHSARRVVLLREWSREFGRALLGHSGRDGVWGRWRGTLFVALCMRVAGFEDLVMAAATVSVLFTDLVGSTALLSRVGEERAAVLRGWRADRRIGAGTNTTAVAACGRSGPRGSDE